MLQYADLCSSVPNLEDVTELKTVPNMFSDSTGLRITYHKSTLVPMHGPEPDLQGFINVLGYKLEGFLHTYLGLPLSNDKLLHLLHLIAKAGKYLASWQPQFLNNQGRVVLVNSVLSSLAVYTMLAMQLPPAVIPASKRRAFLWPGESTTPGAGGLLHGRKYASLKNKLCFVPKSYVSTPQPQASYMKTQTVNNHRAKTKQKGSQKAQTVRMLIYSSNSSSTE